MNFPFSQISLIFLVLLFGGFNDPEKRNFVLPLELLKNECYLIDTVTFDTLFVRGFDKCRKYTDLSSFTFCSVENINEKVCFDEFFKNPNLYLFVGKHTSTTLLLSIFIRSSDTIVRNDPSLESRQFYSDLLNNVNHITQKNEIKRIQLEKGSTYLNGKYYLFLMRGSLLRYASSEYSVNINEYYENIYFHVLCPI